jgi:hypothetical protein
MNVAICPVEKVAPQLVDFTYLTASGWPLWDANSWNVT